MLIIKNRFLTLLPHHFNPTVEKNISGYEYAVCKNIERLAPQTDVLSNSSNV
jgi:hypothetical protein